MDRPADNDEHSITLLDRQRKRDEPAQGVLFVVGDAENVAPPADARVITFSRSLHVGRRAPSSPGAEQQAWVVRDQLVSGQHCVIAREGEVYRLTDLGSRNGTVVDGLLVKEPVKLRDGAIIFIGTHVAVFRVVQANELEAIRSEIANPLGPVATASPAFSLVCQTLRKLAASDCEILLTGETGVGKEVYAHAIHAASGRQGRFVAINCAALPRELVESELYGYVRGAHSQARDPKRGLFEEAEGGTLFLDEVGEMAPELQTKLLRFLQDREIMPLGGTRSRRLDVRILAATSRTTAPTSSGVGSSVGLRPDLAARLGAEPIRLPPLRHRIEDLGTLAHRFVADKGVHFEPMAFQALCLHNWPGNVRELEKAVTNAELLAAESDAIALEHLPAVIAAGPGRIKSSPPGALLRPPPPDARQLEDLLQRFQGNVLRVAREVGRTPPLIYRWCRRYKLDPETYRPK